MRLIGRGSRVNRLAWLVATGIGSFGDGAIGQVPVCAACDGDLARA